MSEAVTITERAARRIGEILKTEPAGSMLRVSVEGGGCSGFQYKFGFEQGQAADDLVLARSGATVLSGLSAMIAPQGAGVEKRSHLPNKPTLRIFIIRSRCRRTPRWWSFCVMANNFTEQLSGTTRLASS